MRAKPLGEIDHLIEKIGIGLVQTVEKYYALYQDNPNQRNAKQYVLWRLRLHRRVNNNFEQLEKLNTARNLGLFDEKPGRTCWDLNFD